MDYVLNGVLALDDAWGRDSNRLPIWHGRPMGACVYIMEAGPSVKIGRAIDPVKRMRGIQTGQPEQVRVFWACRVNTSNAFVLERLAHTVLKAHALHIRGEWFRVLLSKARDLLISLTKHHAMEAWHDPAYQRILYPP